MVFSHKMILNFLRLVKWISNVCLLNKIYGATDSDDWKPRLMELRKAETGLNGLRCWE